MPSSDSKFAFGLVLVLIVAGIAAGAYLFLDRRVAAESEMNDARIQAQEAAKNAEAAARSTTPERAESLNPQKTDAEIAVACERLGLSTLRIPSDHVLVVGRTVTTPESVEASEAQSVLALSSAQLSLFRVRSDGSTDGTPHASSQSNAEGRFFVTVPLGSSYSLHAALSGFLTSTLTLSSDRIHTRLVELGDIPLQTAATLKISVTTGVASLMEPVTPVASIELVAHRADGSELRRGVTDAAGQLNLEGLPREEIAISGALGHYASIQEKVVIKLAVQEVTLNIQVVGRLRLRVKAPSGAIVSEFRAAVDIQRDNHGWMMPTFSDVDSVDKDGFHLIEQIKAGKHDVYATAKGFALGTQSPVEIRPSETTECEITLPLGFPVEGRVVTKKDKRPIENAIVWSEKDLIPASVETNEKNGFYPIARAAKTTEDGRFRLEDLSAGTHKISATHPEFAEDATDAVKLGAGDSKVEVEIALPLGATVEGHVYDTDGAPVEGDMILVLGIMDRNAKKKAPQMANTNAEGFYRVEHVALGTRGIVRSSDKPKPGRPPYDFKMHTFKEGVVDTVNFGEPSRGATLQGRITDAKGLPVSGISLSISRFEPNNHGIPLMYQGSVDAAGNYEVHSIKPGSYTLQIAKSDRGGDFAANGERVVIPESGVVRKDIVLQGGTLLGRVIDATTKQALERGEVALLASDPENPGQTNFVGRADLQTGGKFSILEVPAGTYILVVSAEHHGSRTIPTVKMVSGESHELPPIELSAGGRIVGRVLDKDGRPLAGAVLSVRAAETQTLTSAWALPTLEDGTFTIEYVSVGNYEVTARLTGHDFGFVPAVVEAGGAAPITIRAR